MPLEITAALVLLAFALLCAAWLTRAAGARRDAATEAAEAGEWREAALRHFHEHRDLQRSVAAVLATHGAVRGPARAELVAALGAPRFDAYA